MQEPQHLEAAATLLALAEREFAGGYELLAAEALWGAAAHAVIAQSQRRLELTPQSHGAIMGAARRLESYLEDWPLLEMMKTIQQLHVHFYHGRFSADELAGFRQTAQEVLERLLNWNDAG